MLFRPWTITPRCPPALRTRTPAPAGPPGSTAKPDARQRRSTRSKATSICRRKPAAANWLRSRSPRTRPSSPALPRRSARSGPVAADDPSRQALQAVPRSGDDGQRRRRPVLRGRPGRAVHAPRPQWLWENHDVTLRGRAGAPGLRHDSSRRRRGVFGVEVRPDPQTGSGHGLPELRDLAAHDGVRERRVPVAGVGTAEPPGEDRRGGTPRAPTGVSRPLPKTDWHTAFLPGSTTALTRPRTRSPVPPP